MCHKSDSAFAFLDLLGFSEYIKSYLSGAARLLESQRQILHVKLRDTEWYKSKNSEISNLGRDHLVSSFKNFLPFSDSLFITSETPDLFVRQLGHFLIDAFLFTGHAYSNPEHPRTPTKMNIRVIGGTSTQTEEHYWYPVLWLGGMSFGRVDILETAALKQGQPFGAASSRSCRRDGSSVRKNGEGATSFLPA